jgi:hypothetical protein
VREGCNHGIIHHEMLKNQASRDHDGDVVNAPRSGPVQMDASDKKANFIYMVVLRVVRQGKRSVPAMDSDKAAGGKISPIEKIMEIIGINEPGKKIEQILKFMNVKTGEINQGAFDIQAIYDELERSIKQVGLDKINGSTRDFLKGILSRIKMDNIKSLLASLKIKENVDRLDKVAEILNFHARYQAAKESLEKLGIKNAGGKLKQMLEESVVQERIEDFEKYLEGIGIEQPREKIGELLDAMGLKGAYEDVKDLIGWNVTQPL